MNYTKFTPFFLFISLTSPLSSFEGVQRPAAFAGVVAGLLFSLYTTRHITHAWQPRSDAVDPVIDIFKQPVSAHDFETTMAAFATVMQSQLYADKQAWLNGERVPEKLFDIARSVDAQERSFYPYAQRICVPPEQSAQTEVYLFGDIHGHYSALKALFTRLVRDNVVDARSLKIVRPHTTLIFCGDYVDRENCGVEVINFLFTLKIINPYSVVLLRGNHEDEAMNSRVEYHSFFQEIEDKFPQCANALRQKIKNCYELLPVTCFIQSAERVVQCSHAGLELGYDPRLFLKGNHSISYQALNTFSWPPKEGGVSPRTLARVILSGVMKNYPPVFQSLCQDGRLSGFLWGDFDPREIGDRRHPLKDVDTQGRGIRWSAHTTCEWLDACGIDLLVRGHQHPLVHEHQGMRILWPHDQRVITVHACDPAPSDSRMRKSFNSVAKLSGLSEKDQLQLHHHVVDIQGKLKEQHTYFLDGKKHVTTAP